MRFLITIFMALFTASVFAEVSVSFYGDITPKSLQKLQDKIHKAAVKMKSNEERVVVLDLDSGGGNLYATFDFIETMKDKASKLNIALHTRVKSACESSCTVLYTLGEKRLAGKRAKFGFHSPDVVSRIPRGMSRSGIIEEARDKWLTAVSKISPELAIELESRALLMDEEMSYLTGKELSTTGYVTDLLR